MSSNMDERHKLEILDHNTLLNTAINRLGGKKLDILWKSAWNNQMRDILQCQKGEKLEMEWCRYALQILGGVQPNDKIPDDDPIYFEACREQFLSIYEKLDRWEYRDSNEFCRDIKSIYATFGQQLAASQRIALQTRFEGLLEGQANWAAEHGVKVEAHES